MLCSFAFNKSPYNTEQEKKNHVLQLRSMLVDHDCLLLCPECDQFSPVISVRDTLLKRLFLTGTKNTAENRKVFNSFNQVSYFALINGVIHQQTKLHWYGNK